MIDPGTLHRRAVETFDRRVATVGDDQWHLPTPCSEWDVRALVNHLVAEDLWFAALMAGQSLAAVGDRFDGDLLGEDPHGAWQRARDGALATMAEPGALERTVELSRGPTPASEYVWEILVDHTIHGWDLARATEGDTELDPLLVEAVSGWLEPRRAMLAGTGMFASPVAAGEGASPQARLLAALGRQP